MYHVMNRGDQREVIFQDDEDRHQFLGTLGEAWAGSTHSSGQFPVAPLAMFSGPLAGAGRAGPALVLAVVEFRDTPESGRTFKKWDAHLLARSSSILKA